MTKEEVTNIVKTQIARETGLSIEEIASESDFYSLGLDSISAIFIMDRLEHKLNVEMNPLFFWDYPTVGKFSEHIALLITEKK